MININNNIKLLGLDYYYDGIVVKNTFKNNGYESIFEYDSKYYVISGIGLNGFIISMHPRRK
ncbi:MAG: hypothetical protein WBO70_06295 [Erysipelotrichaceae bacterium]